MFYLFEVRDTDGNDTTVYDAIVEADNQENASDKLWAHLKRCYPKDESDGGFVTFHTCDCSCEHSTSEVCEECRGGWECCHGGILTNEDCEGDYGPRAFTDYDAARASTQPIRSSAG